MRVTKDTCMLYAITDRAMMGEARFLEQVEESLRGGVTMLQLREKNLSEREYIKVAMAVHDITTRYNVPLIINDNPIVALMSEAEGVHVGQQDAEIAEARAVLGGSKIIGATAHNLEEALKAEAEGADYLGVGAAFGSRTKLDARAIKQGEYERICARVTIPVVAIGGITEDNMAELSGRGLSGVAMIGAIYGAANVSEAARRLRWQAARILVP